MEGPSILLAAQELSPFIGKKILSVAGNTTIDKERFRGKIVRGIFSWGKHLVFQFDDFALKVHFLLFGNFEAEVNGKSVTGPYKRFRSERLSMRFKNGFIKIFTSSVKFLETSHAKDDYDFSTDVLSEKWKPSEALKKMLNSPNSEICDLLVDQTIFSGVGNIIKNEILFQLSINPETKLKAIPLPLLKRLIRQARDFSWQFYEWKKRFILRKNLLIYQRSVCPKCGTKIIRKLTGKSRRWSYFCPNHQKLSSLRKTA